jgi:hypothetical protein
MLPLALRARVAAVARNALLCPRSLRPVPPFFAAAFALPASPTATPSAGAAPPPGTPTGAVASAIPSSSPSPPLSLHPPPPPPAQPSRFAALRALGPAAAATYAALWAAPAAAAWAAAGATGNFGIDPVEVLVAVAGAEARDAVWEAVGLAPGEALPAGTARAVVALAAADALEVPRLAATLVLAPRVKKAVEAWRARSSQRG